MPSRKSSKAKLCYVGQHWTTDTLGWSTMLYPDVTSRISEERSINIKMEHICNQALAWKCLRIFFFFENTSVSAIPNSICYFAFWIPVIISGILVLAWLKEKNRLIGILLIQNFSNRRRRGNSPWKKKKNLLMRYYHWLIRLNGGLWLIPYSSASKGCWGKFSIVIYNNVAYV